MTVAVMAALTLIATAASCSTDDTADGCPPLAVAFIGPITGPDGPNGQGFREGIEVAAATAAEVGTAVGVEGCEVGLVTFDSQGDPERAADLARAVVADPQIVAVLGPAYSGETAAVMPAFEAARLPVITASATNPDLATRGWRFFHRVVADDADQAPAAAAFLVDRLAVRTVAVVDDGSLYGQALADLVSASLAERGVVVAPRLQIEPDRLDYRSTVESIAAIGVDAVFFGGVSDPAGRLVRQLRDAGVSAAYAAGDAVFQPQFLVAAGSAAQGTYLTCPCAPVEAAGDTSPLAVFAADHLRLTGRAPTGFAAEYADATRLVLTAIAEGARTRAQVESFLNAIDARGLTKQLTFDDQGQIRGGPIFVFQVVGDAFVPTAEVIDGRVTSRTGAG